jgi:hypothetical protein
MGGDLKKIQVVGKYLVEIWKAVGMDMERVEFLYASGEGSCTDASSPSWDPSGRRWAWAGGAPSSCTRRVSRAGRKGQRMGSDHPSSGEVVGAGMLGGEGGS